MSFDKYNRKIDYLRIAVTDRCNLRCTYCMPVDAVMCNDEKLLSAQEIYELVKVAVEEFGFTKVRLTGGEPLLRSDILDLIKMIKSVNGISDLALTTNGVLLYQFAPWLKSAGIMRINISLDTLDPAHYKALTCGGDISHVLRGITAARNAGFDSIKLNCVVKENSDEVDAISVKEYAAKNNLQARFIKEMDLKSGKFGIVQGGSGGDCARCNRMRLSSDGMLYPCLFNDLRFSLRELGACAALMQAIESKPQKGESSLYNRFYHLGG